MKSAPKILLSYPKSGAISLLLSDTLVIGPPKIKGVKQNDRDVLYKVIKNGFLRSPFGNEDPWNKTTQTCTLFYTIIHLHLSSVSSDYWITTLNKVVNKDLQIAKWMFKSLWPNPAFNQYYLLNLLSYSTHVYDLWIQNTLQKHVWHKKLEGYGSWKPGQWSTGLWWWLTAIKLNSEGPGWFAREIKTATINVHRDDPSHKEKCIMINEKLYQHMPLEQDHVKTFYMKRIKQILFLLKKASVY